MKFNRNYFFPIVAPYNTIVFVNEHPSDILQSSAITEVFKDLIDGLTSTLLTPKSVF